MQTVRFLSGSVVLTIWKIFLVAKVDASIRDGPVKVRWKHNKFTCTISLQDNGSLVADVFFDDRPDRHKVIFRKIFGWVCGVSISSYSEAGDIL